MKLKRTLAGPAAVLLAISLSACGGDGGSSAPDDASVEEFCDSYSKGQIAAFTEMDPDASEQEQGEAMLDALKEWADEMADGGTPEDMPDEARDGFELMVDTLADLDADDIENLQDLEDEFSDDERDAAAALTTYVNENCK
jgi:hypothetical protein